MIPWPRSTELASGPSRRPEPPPDDWLKVIGEYRCGGEGLSIYERNAQLAVEPHRGETWPVYDLFGERLLARHAEAMVSMAVTRAADARAVAISLDGRTFERLDLPDDPGCQMTIAPVRPVAEVLNDARQAQPPDDSGEGTAPPDLVDVAGLDATIRLDLRYASANNFLGHPFYAAPRARLERSVAAAVVRAHRALRAHGFGLAIWDAYRPWYVTRAFWDATPEESRWIVADPARGSRHNRGAAVDVTLVDLASDTLAEMPSTFDEPSPRAAAFYPGGTSRQRWHRALLLSAMETEGFAVNQYEWWHFDHRDWARFGIGNAPVE